MPAGVGSEAEMRGLAKRAAPAPEALTAGGAALTSIGRIG